MKNFRNRDQSLPFPPKKKQLKKKREREKDQLKSMELYMDYMTQKKRFIFFTIFMGRERYRNAVLGKLSESSVNSIILLGKYIENENKRQGTKPPKTTTTTHYPTAKPIVFIKFNDQLFIDFGCVKKEGVIT